MINKKSTYDNSNKKYKNRNMKEALKPNATEEHKR